MMILWHLKDSDEEDEEGEEKDLSEMPAHLRKQVEDQFGVKSKQPGEKDAAAAAAGGGGSLDAAEGLVGLLGAASSIAASKKSSAAAPGVSIWQAAQDDNNLQILRLVGPS